MRRPREDGRIEVGPQEGVAHLVVSREQLRRALLVMQAIFGEARLRGYGVQPIPKDGYGARAGVGVAIRGHAYTIEVTELTDQVPLSEEEVEAWRRQQEGRVRFSWEKGKEPPTHKHVANGNLRVSLPSRWSGARSNWSEGPRGGLETKLPSLFEELERRAAEDDRRAAEHARCEEQWRREWQQRLERERRARVIKDRVERLSGEIASWRLAEETLEYVAALRGRLAQLEAADRDRVSAWCDWAEAWSRETDPTLNVARIGGLDGQRSDDAERARLASPY